MSRALNASVNARASSMLCSDTLNVESDLRHGSAQWVDTQAVPGDNVEIVRELLATNRSGRPDETVDRAVELADSRVELRSRVSALEGGTYHGHEGMRAYVKDLTTAFREWRNEPTEIVQITEDVILADNTFHGIGRDSGVAVELRSAIVFVLAEGKVVRCLSYGTRGEALEAAGLTARDG